MVAIRPTYGNKISSIAMRLVEIGKVLSSVLFLELVAEAPSYCIIYGNKRQA
jgi:hypothetical protein